MASSFVDLAHSAFDEERSGHCVDAARCSRQLRGDVMPITYRIFRAGPFVLSTGLGDISDAELLAHQRELLGDTDFDPGHPQLDDFRDAGMDRITADCIQTLASAIAPSKRGAKRALVVRSDVAYGLARMLQAMREGSRPEIGVFRDLDHALVWLGVS